MLNYCRSLGYDNFSDFKEAMREYIVFWKHPNERISNIESRKSRDLFSIIAKDERELLSYIIENVDEELINKASDLILSKSMIFIAGHGISSVSAEYCRRRLTVIGKNASILEINDNHQMASQLSLYKPEDCLIIVFAISPHGLPTIKATQLCSESGFDIISITDNPESVIASASTIQFTASALILGTTNTILSSIAMIDIIALNTSVRTNDIDSETEERYQKLLEAAEN